VYEDGVFKPLKYRGMEIPGGTKISIEMENAMKAIEVLGTVDEKSQLHIDEPLPITGPSRVRVIVIFSGEEELEEQGWLRTASANPAFEFLNDPVEDIYKPTDGVPCQQQ
jgi:predicted DNA-binding antitoxin AbrB/MazE fold protein